MKVALQAMWSTSRWVLQRRLPLRTIIRASSQYRRHQDIAQNNFIANEVPRTVDKDYHDAAMILMKHAEVNSFIEIIHKCIYAMNYWLEIDEDKMQEIDNLMKMITNTFLILDDIQDNSLRRAGVPTAYTIYGIGMTLNAIIYTIAISLDKCLQLGHPQVLKIVIEHILEQSEGQGLEIKWRENFQCPTEDEYKEMLIKKTASVFTIFIKLMQLFSGNKGDYSKFTKIFGLYVQLINDYNGIWPQNSKEGKVNLEDITEGKFTLPIIHAINKNKNSQVLHILRQRTQNEALKKLCVLELERSGSDQYTRNTLTALDEQIRANIHHLGGNPLLEQLMDELSVW